MPTKSLEAGALEAAWAPEFAWGPQGSRVAPGHDVWLRGQSRPHGCALRLPSLTQLRHRAGAFSALLNQTKACNFDWVAGVLSPGIAFNSPYFFLALITSQILGGNSMRKLVFASGVAAALLLLPLGVPSGLSIDTAFAQGLNTHAEEACRNANNPPRCQRCWREAERAGCHSGPMGNCRRLQRECSARERARK
jgi:hypothetical protein